MSILMVILLCFIQIGVGGMVAMGLIFMAAAESDYSLSDSMNNVLVIMWFAFGVSLFASIGMVLYSYFKGASALHYWWLAPSWGWLAIMLLVWKLSLVKI